MRRNRLIFGLSRVTIVVSVDREEGPWAGSYGGSAPRLGAGMRQGFFNRGPFARERGVSAERPPAGRPTGPAVLGR